MTNEQMLDVMIDKQIKMNDLTFPNWRKEITLDMWCNAIIAEVGEAMESTGYKWWKKQEVDLDNLKVEAIDILHFTISANIINDSINDFKEWFAEDAKLYRKKSYTHHLQDIAQVSIYDDFMNDGQYLRSLFKTLKMDFKDIFIAYMTKNILNEFRQKNGYKNGTYIKIWNGKEDNVVAFDIASTLNLTEDFEAILYGKLELAYSKVLED